MKTDRSVITSSISSGTPSTSSWYGFLSCGFGIVPWAHFLAAATSLLASGKHRSRDEHRGARGLNGLSVTTRSSSSPGASSKVRAETDSHPGGNRPGLRLWGSSLKRMRLFCRRSCCFMMSCSVRCGGIHWLRGLVMAALADDSRSARWRFTALHGITDVIARWTIPGHHRFLDHRADRHRNHLAQHCLTRVAPASLGCSYSQIPLAAITGGVAALVALLIVLAVSIAAQPSSPSSDCFLCSAETGLQCASSLARSSRPCSIVLSGLRGVYRRDRHALLRGHPR